MKPGPSNRRGAANDGRARARNTSVAGGASQAEPEMIVILLQQPPTILVDAAPGHLIHD